ncbi:hypothetical protein GCM10023322_54250 [Rugosimonospora acidiphila]|uniref:Uncharacterized protein n=1 Tax=Rugosimonospora acidiphila TaxID=556531 RepID=A0ABP9S9J3_9ACTN
MTSRIIAAIATITAVATQDLHPSDGIGGASRRRVISGTAGAWSAASGPGSVITAEVTPAIVGCARLLGTPVAHRI